MNPINLAAVQQITDVYGRQLYVLHADLASNRLQLPLYTAGGIKLTDLPNWHARRRQERGALTIHRDNIAKGNP